MTDWRVKSAKNSVALLIAAGIDPIPVEMIARTCGLEDDQVVRDEVARLMTRVPPNADSGCEAK